MKNLIILFFVLISFSSYAQYDSTRVLQVISSNGNDYLRSLKIRGGLIIPTDTPKIAYRDSGAIAYKNGSLYKWGGTSWSAVSEATPLYVTLSPGVDSYSLPDGKLLEKVEIIEPTSITVDIGTSLAGTQIAAAVPVSTGYANFTFNHYNSTGSNQTIYFSNLTGSSVLKLYIR